ncbi:Oidioi.mRNA.OKI2018_I69.XSR.g16369.t1.cds [Oikopleura dioica]|uniref:Oidioi.mRNA.OKI2018_I69.XSR.g16369.t1.cds n=1 Tax=Oikopleura dioica TaxID=34765 RepID=A0ABN7SL01_OIKDI|nr:Oidioi.mRNA.OKI2018_I69.XSR.g16369.t1.cds [Oikopleura dioica]
MLICFLLAIASALECRNLRKNQFICELPPIDLETQEYAGCPREEQLRLRCAPLKGINCTEDGGQEKQFNGTVFSESIQVFAPCRWTNRKYYATAVVLSIFLGVFGIDRFYLGYPVIGLIKLSTCGMAGIGAFIDFILILLHFLGPSDGSALIVPWHGFRPNYISASSNETYFESFDILFDNIL